MEGDTQKDKYTQCLSRVACMICSDNVRTNTPLFADGANSLQTASPVV